MAHNTNLPIVSNGLVFNLDAYNSKSCSGSPLVINDTVGESTTISYSGGIFDGKTILLNFKFSEFISCSGQYDIDGSNEVTFSIWMRNNSDIGNIFNILRGGSGIRFDFVSDINYEVNPVIKISLSDTQNFICGYGVVGEWVNFVIVLYDEILYLYINGIFTPFDYEDDLPRSLITRDASLVFGDIDNDSYFPGEISNFMIYNRGLSEKEVVQNYNVLKNRFI